MLRIAMSCYGDSDDDDCSQSTVINAGSDGDDYDDDFR